MDVEIKHLIDKKLRIMKLKTDNGLAVEIVINKRQYEKINNFFKYLRGGERS
jgi:hypothetical protein